jgi:hypothetical protein
VPKVLLNPLKRRDEEPMFDEPWQAQVLGMADILVTAGVISSDAWATALGAELCKGAASTNPRVKDVASFSPIPPVVLGCVRLSCYVFDPRVSKVEDNAENYYRAVLAALQALLYEAGATSREELDIREDEWRHAYLNTPHGKPVELDRLRLTYRGITKDHD